MKQPKQRVLAIDYFRGVLILIVILNHAAIFSKPFSYLVGDGGLWTSAAELFLVLSGLTFAIVRGPQVLSNFKQVLKKSVRRAAIIYAVNIAVVFLSLLLALIFVSHGLPNDVDGPLPTKNGMPLAISILTYTYSIGWASFLMYFSIFVLLAPFAMYLLKTKYWAALPTASLAIFIAAHSQATHSIYVSFGIWQIYFAMGLIIGRFRHSLNGLNKTIKPRLLEYSKLAVLYVAGAMLGISALLNFPIYPFIGHLAQGGWLPIKVQAAYIHLLSYKPLFDNLFMNTRTGWLRPLMTLFVFTAGYIIYKKYERKILDKSGKFMITMGQNTISIFAAQAIIIPVIAALNLPNALVMNTILTSFLILVMWYIAQADISKAALLNYLGDLKLSYRTNKYSYLSRYEDS
jgi:hypothetical protein